MQGDRPAFDKKSTLSIGGCVPNSTRLSTVLCVKYPLLSYLSLQPLVLFRLGQVGLLILEAVVEGKGHKTARLSNRFRYLLLQGFIVLEENMR